MGISSPTIRGPSFQKDDPLPPVQMGTTVSGSPSTPANFPDAADTSSKELPTRIPANDSSGRRLIQKAWERKNTSALAQTSNAMHTSYKTILASLNEPVITLNGEPVELTVKDALEKLQAATVEQHDSQRRPEWVKDMLQEAIANGHGDDKLCAELTLAIVHQVCDIDSEHGVPGDLLDASILALWKGGLEFARNPVVWENRKKFPQPSPEEIATRSVNTFFKKGLFTEADKEKEMIDIGTGHGFIPACLRKLGFRKAVGLEPRAQSWKMGAQLFKIDIAGTRPPIPLTAAGYMRKYPGKKFPVVTVFNINFGNNNPDTAQDSSDSDENLDEGYSTFISELSSLTEEKLYVGLYGADLQFAPQQSCSLEEHLKKEFQNVEFLLDATSPLAHDDTFASCGLLGVYKCAGPIRNAHRPVIPPASIA